MLGEVGFARRELTSSAATGNDVEGGLGVREGKEGGGTHNPYLSYVEGILTECWLVRVTGFDRPIELYVKL